MVSIKAKHRGYCNKLVQIHSKNVTHVRTLSSAKGRVSISKTGFRDENYKVKLTTNNKRNEGTQNFIPKQINRHAETRLIEI